MTIDLGTFVVAVLGSIGIYVGLVGSYFLWCLLPGAKADPEGPGIIITGIPLAVGGGIFIAGLREALAARREKTARDSPQ